MCHGDPRRTCNRQKLSGVVPTYRLDGATSIDGFDLGPFPEIPDRYRRRVLRHSRQPSAIFGEKDGLDGTSKIESCCLRPRLDIEDFDLSVEAASSQQVTIRVELSTCEA